MKKRGEITSSQIVIFVLAIVGFGIVLFFLLMNSGIFEGSKEEVCRLSVLTRATSPEEAQRLLPLKCTTKKICLTQKGVPCDQFAGEENVETISLEGKDEEIQEKIAENAANAMYSCWQMMGEGKLDLFGSYTESRGLNPAENVCLICSRVAISSAIKPEVYGKRNLLEEYMETHYIPNTQIRYVEYFTDRGVGAYPKVSQDLLDKKAAGSKEGVSDIDPDAKKVLENISVTSNPEIAFVFSQVKTGGYWDKFTTVLQDGAMISGGLFYMAPGKLTTKVGFVLKLVAKHPVVATVVSVGAVGIAGVYTYSNHYTSMQNVAGYCGKMATTINSKDENEKMGCSIVQAVPYEVSNINSICQQIEGKP